MALSISLLEEPSVFVFVFSFSSHIAHITAIQARQVLTNCMHHGICAENCHMAVFWANCRKLDRDESIFIALLA